MKGLISMVKMLHRSKSGFSCHLVSQIKMNWFNFSRHDFYLYEFQQKYFWKLIAIHLLTFFKSWCFIHFATKYSKPTFNHVGENFARAWSAKISCFEPVIVVWLFMLYNKTGLEKAWSGTFVVATQFIGSKHEIKLSQ